MCKYCEIKQSEDSATRKMMKNKEIIVDICINAVNRKDYYLHIASAGVSKRCININYCPICGKKLGLEENND